MDNRLTEERTAGHEADIEDYPYTQDDCEPLDMSPDHEWVTLSSPNEPSLFSPYYFWIVSELIT